MKNNKKITLGILFIATLLLFGWGINYLRGKNLFNKKTTYYIKYNRVNGLMVSNPVTVRGFKIGQVSDISFSSVKNPYIIVKVDIKSDFLIPDNSIAVIESRDIMGSKKINLRLGNSENYVQNNDTLNSKIELGFRATINEHIMPVKAKAEHLMQNLDSIFNVFNRIFSKKTQVGISNSLSSIEETFLNIKQTTSGLNKMVNKEKEKLSSILSNIDDITKNLKGQQTNINQSINNISQMSNDLSKLEIDKTINNLNQTVKDLNSVIEKVNHGNGSAALFINNDSLYRNLEDVSNKLNLLLDDIHKNPKKYVHFSVFGRKN